MFNPDPIETWEHAGYTCELHPDWDDPQSPADWDNFGEVVQLSKLDFALPGARETTGTEDDAIERGGFRLLAHYLRITGQGIAVPFTLQDYGSGGAKLWEDDSDSNEDDPPSGWIFASAGKIAEEFDGNEERAFNLLRGELSNWSAYVEGNVVGFVVNDPETGEVMDSCWGFYPDSNPTPEQREAHGWLAEHADAIEEANASAEHARHEVLVNLEPPIEEAIREHTR